MFKPVWFLGLCLVAPPCAAQSFDFPGTAATDPAALATAMPKLAGEVLAAYRDDDRRRDLDNRFRLQIVAGRDAEAIATLASLRALRTPQESAANPQAGAAEGLYEVFARAKASQDAARSFEAAFQRAFRDTVGPLDDRTAALVIRALGADPSSIEQTWEGALEAEKGKSSLPLAEALALIRAYQVEQVFAAAAPLAPGLIAEDDSRRYTIDRDVQVRTVDGATVCALVVRPRKAADRLTALLNFTIYADPGTSMDEARRTASNGYAGVEGFTRGKGCSPDAPVPYEHDGADADAVIDWISRQPWSDGRVGMYGGSYEGFTQWAAAKHLPKALKALMPSVTAAPGIDVPMEGNVFQTFVYYWPFYTTTNKTLDNAPYRDRARWQRMNHDWYVSGRPYRDLDRIEGTPNPFFDRWLDHPSYDSYWQAMIPYKADFARIDIPVLTTTGYYDGGQIGALYYFIQHHQYNPGAEHYLLIGPYDHIWGQRGNFGRLGGPQKVLNGYEIDPVAWIDLGELRYQWFDYVFKGGPKPALLADRVNYEVMGANEWKHAPSLAAMGGRRVKYYLTAKRSGDGYGLSPRKPIAQASVPLKVDLADRGDVDRVLPGGATVDKEINSANGIVFTSDPFPNPVELSGLFSGRFELRTNKKDLDFSVELYERTAKGEYFQLSYAIARASYARDRTHRHLLTPGRRQTVAFTSGRLTSRRFEPGSRLVAVISVVKNLGAQINYGTGKDVSDEAIADAREPLKIRWLGGSFLDVPLGE
jgi:putative CocE/NonD family hydrolase